VELLERYLKDVKDHLPREQRDDIIRELGENLRAQLDDREAELGRALTEAETQAILVRHGNPLNVAGRYRPDGPSLVLGRVLIGPQLFPIYRRVLGLNLGITLLVCIVLTIVLAGERSPAQLISGAFTNLLIQFAIVTIIFMAGERHRARSPHLWSPRTPEAMWRPATGERTPSRIAPLFDLIVHVVVGLWWLTLPAALGPFLARTAPVLTPGPAWPPFYLGILILTVAEIGAASVAIARPRWVRFRQAAHATIYGLTAGVALYALGIGSWVITGGGEERVRRLAASIDFWCNVSALAMAVIAGVVCLLGAWRLRRREPARATVVAM
jgi:hypothetical protein